MTTNPEPKVDVIIPTYNGLPYLKQTVESILAQTYKNFELYIIDDGSTDKTDVYVKNLKDKRIHYEKKKNGGQSTARNLGIKISSSPYISFIDSDDIWYPEKLEKQMQIMQRNSSVGLVYGHHYLIDEDNIIQGNLRIWKRGKIFDDLCSGNFIAGSASMVLIRRSVFDNIGVFKEDFLIGEDWEMWLRIAQKYEIDFVPEIIAALRQRSDGMQQNHKKMSDGLVYMLDAMTDDFKLTYNQKKNMTIYCLLNAAIGYYASGLRGMARRTLLRLFSSYPREIIRRVHWRIYISFGIYAKAIFGNPIFDLIGKLLSKTYSILINMLISGARFFKHALKRK
jgi:glycosyltransferase involved in cell wall biosynthesis